MAYLTMDEFEDMGGSAEGSAFIRREWKARRLIDRLTHGRIRNEEPVRQAVKMCMFELICAQAEDEAIAGTGGREVAAVSNDGVSVSYATQGGHGSGAAHNRYAAIVRGWLDGEHTAAGVNLLYCGVDA